MKIKNKLLLLVVFIALALPLIYSGTASAIYTADGLVPSGNGLTNWKIKDPGTCVLGVQANGTVTTGAQTNLADCIAVVYPEATSAACVAFTNTDSGAPGSHYWTSTCVNGSVGISLTGLDRTPQNCALKGGTWKSACTNSWKYINPGGGPAVNLTGSGPGFCYASMDLTNTGVAGGLTTSATCLTGAGAPGSTTSGFSLSGTKCLFKYGIEGYLNSAATNKDLSAGAGAEAYENLQNMTYGQCVAAGFSWTNGDVASIVTPTPVTITGTGGATVRATALYGESGCSECHSSLTQDLPYSYFWKGDTYAYTGHKNMLRKVVSGSAWGGPTATGTMAAYTADTSGAINFLSSPPTVTVSGTAQTLLYIFGDWISFAPSGLDAISQVGTAGKENGGGSDYSCAQCHTTGWSTAINSPSTAPTGICSYTSQATQAACTTYSPAGITGWGTGVWTIKSGVQGASYVPPQPNGTSTSYLPETPGITFGGAGSWDQDGIICSRCHAGVFVNGNSNTTSYADEYISNTTSSGMGNVPQPSKNEQVNNVCFGCHGDAFVKTSPTTLPGQAGTGPDVDLNNPTVPSISTDTASTQTFGSHYLGEAFLNSPHARFSGSMSQNVTGTYVVNNNVPTSYNSAFKGYVCLDTTNGSGGDRYSTYWNGTANATITNLEQCNLANGFGTLGSPDTTNHGYWAQESQGACTTCHDVHNTLVLNAYEANALKLQCQDCHSDTTGLGGTGYATAPGFSKIQINLATIGHPKGSNTPFDATRFANPCVTCHMPPTASGADPMHFFRINNSATYTTFPTVTAFSSGWKLPTIASDTHAASGLPYANAVWTDLGFACGQCHYTTGLEYVSGNPVFDVNTLSTYATGIHNNSTIIPSFSLNYGITNLTASVSGSAICGTGATCSAFTYTWTWGDGVTTAGQTTTHAYTTAGTYTITLTVTDTNGNSGQKAEKFIAIGVTAAPVASFSTPCASALTGMTASLTDNSSNLGTGGGVKVFWGDGLSELQYYPISTAFTHTYLNPGTYTITQYAFNAAGVDSTFNQCVVSMAISAASTLTGTVTDLATAPLGDATVQAQMVGSAMKTTVYTNASGVYSLPLEPGTYNIYVYAPGYTFNVPATTVAVPHAGALNIQSLN
jgi:hypothetical protein